MNHSRIKIGMNGRFFPGNWRAARDEIVFASMAGFDCIQFPGLLNGLDTDRLGDPLNVVGVALQRAQITAVMEIVISLSAAGRTVAGATPVDVLKANLQAIKALQCRHVHWHLVADEPLTGRQRRALEQQLIPQMADAVALAHTYRFQFAFEHNADDAPLFHRPDICADALTAVPGLGLVWDINHTAEREVNAYAALADRVSMLHVSDTRWPDVNHHLPLGQGNLDTTRFLQPLLAANFTGPAILEIGGMPKSGGFGRDTNAALLEAKQIFQQTIQALSA